MRKQITPPSNYSSFQLSLAYIFDVFEIHYFASKKTMKHSQKSRQCSFKYCAKLSECFKRRKSDLFSHVRLSNLFNKMVCQMTILTEFGNLHSSFK